MISLKNGKKIYGNFEKNINKYVSSYFQKMIHTDFLNNKINKTEYNNFKTSDSKLINVNKNLKNVTQPLKDDNKNKTILKVKSEKKPVILKIRPIEDENLENENFDFENFSNYSRNHSSDFRLGNQNEKNDLNNSAINMANSEQMLNNVYTALEYLSYFNENYFTSDEEINRIVNDGFFDFDLENSLINKSFSKFCKNFPLFSIIIIERNVIKMIENKKFFDDTNLDLLREYFTYFKVIFKYSNFMINKEFYLKKVSNAIRKFFDRIKIEQDIIKSVNSKDLTKNPNTIILEFIMNLRSNEIIEMESISIFHFFYSIIENYSKIKDILISDEKLDFNFDLKNLDFSFQIPIYNLLKDKVLLKKNLNYTSINSGKNYNVNNSKVNLRNYIIHNFPNIFINIFNNQDFNSNLSITKHLFNLILMYEIEFIEDKKNIDMKLSLFLNVIDETLEKHIMALKNDYLIMNLLNIISSYKIISKSDLRGFQNIYIALAKKFMRIEDIFDSKNSNYLFMYFLFLKFVHKSSYSLKDVSYLFNSNFYYIDFLIKAQPEKLSHVSDWLLCHLLMVFGYCNFNVHENLYLEIKKRIPKILEDFNNNIITYLVTGMVLNNKKDDAIFYEILTNKKFLSDFSQNKKNFLNVGFYISLSLYDNVEGWKKYFEKLEKFTIEFNDHDRRQVLEMIMSMMISKNIKEDLKFNDYIGKIYKNIYFKSDGNEGNYKSKWFINVSASNGLAEHQFRIILQKNKIEHVYQKTLFDIFDVDFVIGNKIAIYLNGPVHYFINGKEDLNLKSLSKTRILEDKGYYVVNVPLEDCSLISHKMESAYIILDYIKGKLPQDVYEKYFNNNDINSSSNKEKFITD